MRVSGYMPGPTICGFHGVFESDFGIPTDEPYPVVTPQRSGAALLPFRCPHCGRLCNEFSDAKTREHYHDTREERTADGRLIVRHNNYFCPGCRKRFRIDLRGVPVKSSILGVIIGAIFGSRKSEVAHAVHVLGAAPRAGGNAIVRRSMQTPQRMSTPSRPVRAPISQATRPKPKGGNVAQRAAASIAAGKRAIAAGQAAMKAGKVAQGKRAIASGQRALAKGQAATKMSIRGDDGPFADDALPLDDDPFAQPDNGGGDDGMSDGGALAAADAALDDPNGWQQQDSSAPPDDGFPMPPDDGGGSSAQPDSGGGGGGSPAGGDAGTVADTTAADADAAAAALAAEIAITQGASSFDA